MLAAPNVSLAVDLGFVEFDLTAMLLDFLYTAVITITGWFMGLGAMLLNWGISDFVLGFARLFNETGVGVAVDSVWTLIRDFVNMTFIFGLVYIGFRMILESNDSQTKHWLATLIMAALLINFSLFITKAIIEVSNQFAVVILESGFTVTEEDGRKEVNIGGTLMDSMGLSSTLGIVTSQNGEGLPEGQGLLYIAGTGTMFMVAGFVFAVGGVLLIIRFAVLMFYLVLSPVLFLGWILPPLSGSMNKYWRKFLGESFFAPVYVLMLYFSFKILDGMQQSIQFGRENMDAGALMSGSGAEVIDASQSVLPFFILTCFFLIGSIVVSQRMVGDISNKAINVSHRFRQRAQRATGRWTARQTAGRAIRSAGMDASNAESSLNRRIATMSQGGATSRAAARFLDRTAGAGLRGVQNASVAGSESYNARNQRVETQNARLNQMAREQEREANVNNQETGAITRNSTTQEIDARQNERRRRRAEVQDMSNDEILNRAREDIEAVTASDFASLMTDGHITALRNSGILSNPEMEELEQNREDGIFEEAVATLNNTNATSAQLEEATQELTRIMSKMSDDQLTKMVRRNENGGLSGQAWITNPGIAALFSDNQMDTLRNSGQLSNVEFGDVRAARNQGLSYQAQNGTLASQGVINARNQANDRDFQNSQERTRRRMFNNAQNAAKLPVQALASSPEYLTPRIIDEYMRTNPNPQDLETIRRSLRGFLAGPNSQSVIGTWQNWVNNQNNSVMTSRFNPFNP